MLLTLPLGIFHYFFYLTPGFLTDLSAWVGFYTSSPQQGVKFELWYLNFCFVENISIKYPMKNSQRQSSCPLGV